MDYSLRSGTQVMDFGRITEMLAKEYWSPSLQIGEVRQLRLPFQPMIAAQEPSSGEALSFHGMSLNHLTIRLSSLFTARNMMMLATPTM